MSSMKTLVFLCLTLTVVVYSAVVQVNVDYDAIYPTSSYLQPGDTLQFVGTKNESHFLVTVLPDFSGPNFTGQVNSGPQSGFLSYSVNIVDDRSQQGIIWSDLSNPATSAFGVIYVARTNDYVINFNVFQNHPPGPTYQLSTQYPKNVQIGKGRRVVWDTSEEPLLNHPLLFADRQFHGTIGCPFSHPFVSNRNFHHFAYQFNQVGKYNFICGVHYNMNGTIHVCETDTSCSSISGITRSC